MLKGWVVAIPQACRTDVNYGTPEWIREIFFTKSQADIFKARVWAASKLDKARLENEVGARGCGQHGMSR